MAVVPSDVKEHFGATQYERVAGMYGRLEKANSGEANLLILFHFRNQYSDVLDTEWVIGETTTQQREDLYSLAVAILTATKAALETEGLTEYGGE